MREIIRQKIMESLAAAPPAFTRRDAHIPRIAGKAIAVIGPRRAGKTTFLWQILSDRLAAGMAREGLLYFSFEDERLAEMKTADLSLVVEEYYRLHPEWRDQRRAVFFLDEIQSAPGWETFARRLLDTERVELFLSGSSARLLSREVATAMRGRAMETLVFPFSFREFLRHRGQEPKGTAARQPKAARSKLDKALLEYLSRGGYPEAQGAATRDRFDLLRGYVDTAMLRDVIERHAVSHPIALRWMTRHLLGAPSGAFSVHKFCSDLRSQGGQISKDTLHAYLAHLEDAFLIRTVAIATESERRRMVNPRKAYPIDPGLIPVFDRSGKSNIGHALETAAALDLEQRGAEVAYVRTSQGYEVDFLARYSGDGEELIQVCAALDDDSARERECRALLAAAREHPRAALYIVCLSPEGAKDIPKEISVIPASGWLLR
ncbi:MAG: ATP-binding protein [Candidatus Sumerlaeota bacterium]|nr:ATP-binding protein [Candidatus Sumerlaeota bacterium]